MASSRRCVCGGVLISGSGGPTGPLECPRCGGEIPEAILAVRSPMVDRGVLRVLAWIAIGWGVLFDVRVLAEIHFSLEPVASHSSLYVLMAWPVLVGPLAASLGRPWGRSLACVGLAVLAAFIPTPAVVAIWGPNPFAVAYAGVWGYQFLALGAGILVAAIFRIGR